MSTTMSSDRRFVTGRVTDPWSLVTTDDDPFAETPLAGPTPEQAQKFLVHYFNHTIHAAASSDAPTSDYDIASRHVTATVAGIILAGQYTHESPLATWDRVLEYVSEEADLPELVSPAVDGRRERAIAIRNALWGVA